MKLSMPEISVIVPVYNTGELLPRMIDSVLAQSFKDFELILVDDGSSDNSGDVCDQYAEADKRVKAIHSSNHGASAARNRGIQVATAPWITFIDSDDFVLPDYLSNMLSNGQKYGSDLVMTGIQRVCEYDPGMNVVRDWPELAVDRADIAVLYENNILQYQKGPVIKLFKTEIVDRYKVRFDEKLSRGEDALFVYTYLQHCTRMSVAPGANYMYCLRQGSLMSQIMAPFQTELYGYERMKSVLLELTEISHPYPRHYLVYWFDRVINSIYSIGNSYAFADRMRFLKQLDFSVYEKWKEPISWKDNINKQLLCGRHFLLYDVASKLLKS